MAENTHEILRRWLAEEGAERPGAESLLRELLLAMEDPRPRPEFAECVLSAAGIRREPRAWSWPQRAALAFALVLTGSVLSFLPSFLVLVANRITLSDIVSSLARALTMMVDYLPLVLTLGKILGALYDALLLVLTSPPVALVWIGTIGFSVLTARWLTRLLSPREASDAQRNPRYV